MRATPSVIQAVAVLMPFIAGVSGAVASEARIAQATATQPITIRFAAKVGQQPFACGSTYSLGKPATNQTLSDFRFYVSEIALIDATGKAVPVTLEQDNKWQYQNVALLDFENKTGACVNGTTQMRDRVVGTVPKGKYTGVRFTLGVPFNLNHEDAAIAPSPLNLTGLWWNWQLGYKFARIDLQNSTTAGLHQSKSPGHGAGRGEETSSGFPIHLGSTGCQMTANSEKPTQCSYPNRATIVLKGFDPLKHTVVADLGQLVVGSNLRQNQPKTAPGCMSEPNDQNCMSVMTSLGLPFMGKSATSQTFFRVE
jgi:uncharacterized repeat protein (TIGR04052 family)